MPRLTEAVREDRRSQIADAAMRCFRVHGFAHTSMAEIIAASGLSAGSIYSHFSSKAELARHASMRTLERRRESLHARTGALGAVLSPEEVLRHILADKRADPDAMSAVLQIWAESTHDEDLADVVRDNLAVVRDVLHEALEPWAAAAPAGERDAAKATDTVLLLMHGFIVRANVDPDADFDALVDSVAAMLH
jgi:AcrR family transcriptional regulator